MDLLKIELADFGNLFRTDPAKLSDQELLSLDFILHKAWKVKRDGGRIHFGEKSWSFEDIINLHALIRKEMSKRGFQHTLNDELDEQTQPLLKSNDTLAPVYPSGIELGREIRLDEVLPQIKSFYAHPIFAWIVGGLANWGKTKGDIDVLWWTTPEIPEYLKKILEFRFGRQFKDGEISKRVQHHLNYFQGPFTKAVPIYGLKVERINTNGEIKEACIQDIGFKPEPVDLVWDELHKGWTVPDSLIRNPAVQESTDQEKQLRSATAEIESQAEASAKEDIVKLFRFFYPLKPTRGHKPNEPQSVETFLRFFKDNDFPVYSSKKYDGADYVIFRDGNKVQMISEDGRDNTDRFPKIVSAIKNLPVSRFVILSEVERWEDDKHLPRETVIAYVNQASEPDDSDFVANVYDIIFFESETAKPGDIHKLPFVDRLKFLEAVGLPQSTDEPPDLDLKLNMVPHYSAGSREELKKQTEKLRRLEGSEGNVAKKHDFVYNLQNKPSGMVKFHNAAILRGIVTEAKETKTPEVFNFFYGLDFQNMKVPNETIRSVKGKMYHEIGTTFSSALSADAGDIIDVEFETLNVTRNIADGTVSVSAWAPRVLGISKKGHVMTIGEAMKSAREGFVLQEKEITEDGEIIYKGVRQAFGSYGGKRFLAHRIAAYIPHHRTYSEPFAGGAAVFFAKDPSPKEVLNDRDPEIAFMYKFIRDHTPEDRNALAKRDWTMRREIFERLKNLKPQSDRDRFYKAFYLTRASYGKKRGESYDISHEGRKIDFLNNIENAQMRLNKVIISNKDYLQVLKEYDSPETFFYMDPPYPGKYNFFSEGFEHQGFIKAIKGLKAKWIISYPSEKSEAFKGYNVYRVKRRNHMKGKGGNQEWVTELMVSNFPLKPIHLYIEKDLTSEPEGMESFAPDFLPHTDDEIEKVQAAFKSPGGKYRLYKKIIRVIPEHKTFVEAFCGGAQVFFHKKPSDEEVINDLNHDLMFAYRFIKNMTSDDWEWLKKQNWVISRTRARKIFEMKPKTPRERFYRFAYLNKSTYWGRTEVWESTRSGKKGDGYHIKIAHRLPEIQKRLKGVKILSKDWKEIIKEYDSKDTLFYLDPPYPHHWPQEGRGHGSKFFKEEELLPMLKNIKGKFILSYEMEKLNLFKGFRTYRVLTLWTGAHQLGVRRKYELLVSNFSLKPVNLYMEKSLEPIIKQDEIFNFNPPEEETYRYVIQSHWRGMSEHKDFRIENLGKEFLVGWTLADLIEGVVKEPVQTLEDAKRWSKDGSVFKIDFKTGKFKERKTRAGNIVPADIRAFPKAKEPHIWLEVQGVTPPFPAPGSTKQYRGVFLIEDEGTAEYGAQKLDVHEYFLHGKLKGRLVIRRLAREALQESSKVLPPGKIDEAPITTTTLWVAIQPLDQTPIVLTEREVEKKWLPPFGISALPKTVRKLIPAKYQYWKIEDRKEALKIRDNLVTAFKMGEVKIDFNKVILETIEKQVPVKVPFVLQYQTFRGPIVVRYGPSKEFWTLRIATSPNRVLAFQLSSDPTKSKSLSATLDIERTDAYMKVEGDVPPGSPLNPTKDTPSNITILDKGETFVLIDNETFKKFEFRGKKITGLWITQRPDIKISIWEFTLTQQVEVRNSRYPSTL